MSTPTTGQLLLARGAVTADQLARAEKAAKAGGGRICSQLLAMGACSEETLARVLAEKHGVPGVDLSRTVIPRQALERVPAAVAQGDLILPLSLDGGRLHLAMCSPREAERAIDEVRFVTGLEVSCYVAVLASLRRAIAEAYAAWERGEPAWRGAAAGEGEAHLAAVVHAQPEEEVLEIDEGDVEPLAEETAADEPLTAASGADAGEPPEIEIAVGDVGGEVVAEVASARAPRRILVVDDEPEIRLLAERALASRGYVVETASDGEEALARIGETLPDLVLLDAMLPKLHGFEVCRRVRSDARTRTVPIVIMTAIYRGWRFAQDARENYGAEDYIEKPFHLEDLHRRVEAVLESTASRKVGSEAPAGPSIKRGKELLLAGRIPEAIASLEEALRADPFSAEAHYQLGKALRARGDHFRAMGELERAVELREGFFAALRTLAAVYTEKGFRRKAAETLERALAAAPDAATRDTIKRDLLSLL